MSESARSILRHLYKEGRMTEWQYDKIDRNLKERPRGEWEQVGEMTYKCTKCGWLKKTGLMPYCENCGADMRKRGEAE